MSLWNYFLAAASNTPAEGCLPGVMNDDARQTKADLRAAYNALHWVQYGDGDGTATWTYVSGSSIKTAADVTSTYHLGRRLKITGTNTGTVYASIASSAYAGGFTTLGMLMDGAGVVSDTDLTVWVGLQADNPVAPLASVTIKGVAELATPQEIRDGESQTLVMTPGNFDSLASVVADGGRYYLPGKFLIQWGSAINGEAVTFNPAYPDLASVYGVVCSPQVTLQAGRIAAPSDVTQTGFTMTVQFLDGDASAYQAFWIALGKIA
jgi:hypothetical protein